MLKAPAVAAASQHVAPARFVTVELAATITGLSPGAVRKRIERGFWQEGREWKRAPDGRIWIDMRGVETWIETA
jgi:hypothetical protein